MILIPEIQGLRNSKDLFNLQNPKILYRNLGDFETKNRLELRYYDIFAQNSHFAPFPQ